MTKKSKKKAVNKTAKKSSAKKGAKKMAKKKAGKTKSSKKVVHQTATKLSRVKSDLCNDPNPPFACLDPNFIQCVVSKHELTKPQHNAIIRDITVGPKEFDVSYLGLPNGTCGVSMLKIECNFTDTSTNDDITASLIDWQWPVPQGSVCYSDIFLNTIMIRDSITNIELRKAKDKYGNNTVAIAFCVGTTAVSWGDLTSGMPLYGEVVP